MGCSQSKSSENAVASNPPSSGNSETLKATAATSTTNNNKNVVEENKTTRSPTPTATTSTDEKPKEKKKTTVKVQETALPTAKESNTAVKAQESTIAVISNAAPAPKQKDVCNEETHESATSSSKTFADVVKEPKVENNLIQFKDAQQEGTVAGTAAAKETPKHEEKTATKIKEPMALTKEGTTFADVVKEPKVENTVIAFKEMQQEGILADTPAAKGTPKHEEKSATKTKDPIALTKEDKTFADAMKEPKVESNNIEFKGVQQEGAVADTAVPKESKEIPKQNAKAATKMEEIAPNNDSENLPNQGANKSFPRHCAKCDAVEKESGEFKTCAKCRDVYYCNKACQKAHFKVHKKTCCKADVSKKSLGENRQANNSTAAIRA